MSKYKDYDTCVKQGLEHVGEHLSGHREREPIRLTYIRTQTGSFQGCVNGLLRQANAEALMAWFADYDLSACKRWAYTAGKLDRMLYQINPRRGMHGPIPELRDMLMPVLADHKQLITWFAEFDAIDVQRAQLERTEEFITYQAKLALRGDWNRLAERSERFLRDIPKPVARFESDNRFHLALARGDVQAMENALRDIVAPRSVRWRNRNEGYMGWFVVCEAVIYAKIAWRHGYQVEVDTPWIPKEWLPIEPLPEYRDPFDFMEAFDIDTPLPEK